MKTDQGKEMLRTIAAGLRSGATEPALEALEYERAALQQAASRAVNLAVMDNGRNFYPRLVPPNRKRER